MRAGAFPSQKTAPLPFLAAVPIVHFLEYADTPALDAGLLAAAQAVEHYEISRYGTLKTWAGKLGHKDAVKLLDETLAEEKKTDDALSKLAVSAVNAEAA